MNGSPPTDPESRPVDQNRSDQNRTGLLGRRMLTPRESLQPDDAPPPPPRPPRRRPALSAISGFLSFLLLLAGAAVGGLALLEQNLRAPGPLTADKVVVIAPRTEVQEILNQLQSEGVIENPLLVNFALVLEGSRSKVKAGEYLFKQEASLQDVIDTLVSGKEILHSITIAEGLTSEQIVQKLRESDLLSGDVRDIPKEGTLLPETYRVARGMSRNDLLRKMQDDQKRVLDQIWSRHAPDTPLHSPYELVTLASIVEKETGKADERPRVAGVFLNRLTKRMRLQSDPTIVYGLVGGKGTLGRSILRSEVDRPTPYNTYLIEGLPPGPIANPGRAAMEAVANPSRTRELYFVADGTGGHAFAETLDQHNKNVLRWRQIEKDARDQKIQSQSPAVDHQLPDLTAPPNATGSPPRDQRGELLDPAEGATGAIAAVASPAPVPAPSPPAVQSIQSSQSTNGPRDAAPAAQGRFAGMSFAAPVPDELFQQPATARSLLDGPVDEPGPGPGGLTTYPMKPDQLAEMRARSARLGLPMPDGTAPPVADPPTPKIVRIYDASEGTPLDPLKDKTWDLNSAKTIPDLPPPGAPPVTARPAPRAPAAKLAAKPPAKPKPAAPVRARQPAKPLEAPAPAAADETD